MTVQDDGVDMSDAIFEDPDDWEAYARQEAAPGVIMPPAEYLPKDRLADTAYVFGVSEDTIRDWRTKHRGASARGAGRPRRSK